MQNYINLYSNLEQSIVSLKDIVKNEPNRLQKKKESNFDYQIEQKKKATLDFKLNYTKRVF